MRAGIKFQMIPYAGGPSQALSDLIAGRVAIVLEGYGGIGPGLEAGSTQGHRGRGQPITVAVVWTAS